MQESKPCALVNSKSVPSQQPSQSPEPVPELVVHQKQTALDELGLSPIYEATVEMNWTEEKIQNLFDRLSSALQRRESQNIR